jgi:hypothetical protein
MPKRSNAFQKLIAHITEQVASSGATVQESVLLREQGCPSPSDREVDVLLELESGVSRVRIAIECRDHARRANVEWIDGLIGKYQHLEIDQIIAVARAGFTKGAREKAAAAGIQLMTLEEASEHEWPKEFIKLGVFKLSQHHHVRRASFQLDADGSVPVESWNEVLVTTNGETEVGTAAEFIEVLKGVAVRQSQEIVKSRMLEYYKVVADLDKVLRLEWTVPVTGATVRTAGGSEHTIQSVTFHSEVKSEREDLAVARAVANQKAMITSAVIADPQNPRFEIRLDSVQIAGQNKIRVFSERRQVGLRNSRRRKSKGDDT